MIDTNVFTGAIFSADGVNRKIVRACLEGRVLPLLGQTLFNEYEDLLSREHLYQNCPLSPTDRMDLLNALLSASEWVKLYFSWRPNLPDESDNHLIELAVAGSASCIVTHNHKHLNAAELRFPGIRILSPAAFLKELP